MRKRNTYRQAREQNAVHFPWAVICADARPAHRSASQLPADHFSALSTRRWVAAVTKRNCTRFESSCRRRRLLGVENDGPVSGGSHFGSPCLSARLLGLRLPMVTSDLRSRWENRCVENATIYEDILGVTKQGHL